MSLSKPLASVLLCVGGIGVLAAQVQNRPAPAPAAPGVERVAAVSGSPEGSGDGPCVPCGEPEEIDGWTYQGVVEFSGHWYHMYTKPPTPQVLLVPCENE